jgi:predicted transcriptional regulator
MHKWPPKALDSESRLAIITKLFYNGPMTVKQMADAMGLSSTTVLRHVEILVDVEFIKEVQVPDKDKAFKRERYYDVTFPIWSFKDRETMRPVYERIGAETAAAIKKHIDDLKKAFEETELRGKGWEFDDPNIYSYIMSTATCTLTRQIMEKEGLQPILDERPGNKWGVTGYEAEELGEPDI